MKKKHNGPFQSLAFNPKEVEVIEHVSDDNQTVRRREDIIEGLCSRSKKVFEKLCPQASNHDEIYLRHPLAYLMEVADDISYIASDIEDALSVGSLSQKELERSLKSCDFKFLDSDFREIKPSNINIHEIKSRIIKTMISFAESEFRKAIVLGKKRHKNAPIDILNDLPIIFLDYTLKHHNEKVEKEMGNFLYLGERGVKYYNFRKATQDIIFSSRKVVENNSLSLKSIKILCDGFFPKKVSDKDYPSFIMNLSSYTTDYGEEWRESLIEVCTEKGKDMRGQIENILLDFISSLTDKEAIELARQMKRSPYLKNVAA